MLHEVQSASYNLGAMEAIVLAANGPYLEKPRFQSVIHQYIEPKKFKAVRR